MKRFLCVLLLYVLITEVTGQTTIVREPVVMHKSHRTVQVDSVVLQAGQSFFYFHITNELDKGGWFCLSERIHLFSGDTLLSVASSIEGVPLCPDSHAFTYSGEKINFRVIFPIPSLPALVTMEEKCDQACLLLEDVVLDPVFNRKARIFEHAVSCYRYGDYLNCVRGFEKVLKPPLPLESTTTLYAYAYYYIICGYLRAGKREEGLVWYYRLQKSEISQKMLVIRRLQQEFQLPD